MSRTAPVEPTADLRQIANFQRQYFAALLAEGFTEQQALTLLGQWLAVVMTNSNNGGESTS